VSFAGVAATVGIIASAAQEAHLAHLLAAHGHRDIAGPGGHGQVGLAHGGGAGGAGIGHVDHRYARLADLMEDALADHGVGLVEVAAHQERDVLDADSGVLAGF